MDKRCIMMVAGEASGDLHGAHLIRAMRRKHPALEFYGIGGKALKAAGAEIIFESSRLSVVGITEVFSKLPEILRGMSAAKKFLRNRRPDLLILIDFPDFNLHLAGTAKKIGIPVLYYISPQIWAWRQGRVKKMKKIVEHVAVILPFEEKFYRVHRVPATFVGHPLLDNAPAPVGKPKNGKLMKHTFVVGLVPGSRDGEINRHLPVMLEAARRMRAQLEHVKFIVALAPSIEKNAVDQIIAQYPQAGTIEVDTEGAINAFGKCDLIVTASGTVTLEAAIAGTPMVIIYKVSPISYWLGRALIKVNAIGLVNLIAGKKIVPELVQDEANPETIADVVIEMLNNPKNLEAIRYNLLKTCEKLGGAGASDRTADIAIRMLK